MITLKQAVKIAKKEYKKQYGTSIYLDKSVLDDGEYFIFDSLEELDDSMLLGISKEDGKIIEYFPPDHDNFLKAKELKF